VLTTAPMVTQVEAMRRALQTHCPDNIEILHISILKVPETLETKVVVTVTRDGNDKPISFWVKTSGEPTEHWFPYRDVLARIGLLT
jgi:hypothetical protein